MKNIFHRWAFLLFLATLHFTTQNHSASADENWSRFRGPNGEGISLQRGIPTEWSETDYEWTIQLPGKGHSSPVVWGQFLFLTSGLEDGTRTILCIDSFSGEERWAKSIQLLPNKLHKKNSYGSGSPTTDGKRVYVAEADPEHFLINAYDFEGSLVWQRDLGPYAASHGIGISPVVYQDMLIVPNDQDGPSSIEALDLETGETRWSTERKVETASYATPMIAQINGVEQIITLSGATGIAGLDPLSGKEIWASGRLPQRTVASPVYANGLFFATCGEEGRGTQMIAVDPLRKSDDLSLVHAVRKKMMPYVPTPLTLGDYMYLWNDDGTACCLDLRDDLQKNVWRERIGGNYSGSPVIIDGRIYCISEEGDVKIIDASPKFRAYPGGKIPDESYSTPAIANGRLYLRGFHTLSCLKSK
ncbi:PQQ-binding-like beta-propeller repeat protein [Planctomicrobium sp. SH668]|uniref:PQQ-binding-like beta-propeller repeat protein n=1 Tax=Planctomicrobium sp. SH668 TaxID=3448126 RepID=UPI003F5C2504